MGHKNITPKELRALQIVKDSPATLGITPKNFGLKYFDTPEYEHLLFAVCNIGNGAAAGVKAWRLAGGILGKLAKKGLVRNQRGHYHLTFNGEEALKWTQTKL